MCGKSLRYPFGSGLGRSQGQTGRNGEENAGNRMNSASIRVHSNNMCGLWCLSESCVWIRYTLPILLTPGSWELFEKLVVAQITQEIPSSSSKPKVRYRFLDNPLQVPSWKHINQFYKFLSSRFYNLRFEGLCHPCVLSHSALPIRLHRPKHFCLPYLCYMLKNVRHAVVLG